MAIDPAALAALMHSGAPSPSPQAPAGGGDLASLLAPGLMGAGSSLAKTGMALMNGAGPQQMQMPRPMPPAAMGGGMRPVAPAQPPMGAAPGGAPGGPAGGIQPGMPPGQPGAPGQPGPNPLVLALLKARMAQQGGGGGLGM